MEKRFVTEQEHLVDGFRLGAAVYASGFRPSFIVGLWRGGSTVGIMVQECLDTLGVTTDHIALRTSYRGREDYEQTFRSKASIRVHGRQYLLENINAEDRLLIVDDVFSSGRHSRAVIDSLATRLKRNMPQEVKVAATWYRPPPHSAEDWLPDFYIHKTEQWLVLPYELTGLTTAELAEHKPFVLPLLDRKPPTATQSS